MEFRFRQCLQLLLGRPDTIYMGRTDPYLPNAQVLFQPNCKRAWLRNDCKTQAQELKLKPNTFDCQTIISVTALYTKQQWFPPETSVLHDNEEPKWLDGGWKKLHAR
nr:hypothetical protein [Tanacetum cinerariifolium]